MRLLAHLTLASALAGSFVALIGVAAAGIDVVSAVNVVERHNVRMMLDYVALYFAAAT